MWYFKLYLKLFDCSLQILLRVNGQVDKYFLWHFTCSKYKLFISFLFFLNKTKKWSGQNLMSGWSRTTKLIFCLITSCLLMNCCEASSTAVMTPDWSSSAASVPDITFKKNKNTCINPHSLYVFFLWVGRERWIKEDIKRNKSHVLFSRFWTRDPTLPNHGSRRCKSWG